MCSSCGGPSSSDRCRSCGAKARWAASHPLRPCEACAAPITGRNRARARFCSQACRVATRSSYTGRSTNRVTLTCEGCAVAFDVPASNAARHRFCTLSCSLLHRGVTTSCEGCGALYHHGVSTLGKRRHCSRACYRRSTGETTIEARTREVLDDLGVLFWQEVPIAGRRWVVDFLVGSRLVLEVDGTYWHAHRPDVDARKTADLTAIGFDVLRIPEVDVVAPGYPAHLAGLLLDRGVLDPATVAHRWA